MAPADLSSQSVKYLPTREAYDRWASVYDTDGNFLQALDDIEMRSLFPKFTSTLPTMPRPLQLVDLGCGTGRNTVLLLGVDNAEVLGLDESPAMLAVAEQSLLKITGDRNSEGKSSLKLGVFDLLASESDSALETQAHGMISTLVLEHVPLDTFFKKASSMLMQDGILLLTNMHADMGQVSQAGFLDTETGEKIRPTSYKHTVEDVVATARRWGLMLVEGESNREGDGKAKMVERTVTEELSARLGPRSRKWIGITCWFGGLFVKSSPQTGS